MQHRKLRLGSRLFAVAATGVLLCSGLGLAPAEAVLAQQPVTETPQPATYDTPSAATAEPTDTPSAVVAAPVSDAGPDVVVGIGPGLSQPLRSMAPLSPDQIAAPVNLNPVRRKPLPIDQGAAAPGAADQGGGVQLAAPSLAMPAPVANFEGISNGASGPVPPDTEGDIGFDPATGKTYYMQFVNFRYEIWDVTNPASPSVVAGPSLGTNLWSGLASGLCKTTNGGDPVLLFDHLANRWFASQLAYSFGPSNTGPFDFHQCIAVSTSANPAGTWNAYDFSWGSGASNVLFNDYPKFGVWPDGYYLSVNQFLLAGSSETWAGPGVAVFDRAAMLSGSVATMQRFNIPLATNYSDMQPSNLSGPPPAAGAPNPFIEWDDSTWLGDASDTVRVWNFHVDWGTPANSTFGTDSSFTPNQLISTQNVDPNLCNYLNPCVPQPGTTQKLDALSDRLMYRLQYRNFGAYQTLVINRTVDTNGADHAGIYWFELRNSGAGWSMRQQGVYSPADSAHRWMGSIAMDRLGDMALGFSLSSSLVSPSVMYAGRLGTDTLGTLPQGETTMISGAGSQTGDTFSYRWGDYSTMSVDPITSCTFWYTQEYYPTSGGRTWHTRIGSFHFPPCAGRVPTDFDHDFKTDPAKYIAAGAVWYMQSGSGNAWAGTYIGNDGTYVVNSDFDGDGKVDPAKYIAAGAIWYLGSADDAWHGIYIGNDGTPVAASDFDGDGKTDPAKLVGSTLSYLPSSGGGLVNLNLGSDGTVVPGCDFDGDGKTDPAKIIPAGSLWYMQSGSAYAWTSFYMGSDASNIVN